MNVSWATNLLSLGEHHCFSSHNADIVKRTVRPDDLIKKNPKLENFI